MCTSRTPVYRVVIGTNNYAPGDTPEEAAERALAGFLRLLPEELRRNWRVLSVELAEPATSVQAVMGTPSVTEGLPNET
jgi:hypothetical protein